MADERDRSGTRPSTRRLVIEGLLLLIAIDGAAWVNLSADSVRVRSAALLVVFLGMAVVAMRPALFLLRVARVLDRLDVGSPTDRPSGMSRLNQLAADNKELVEAIGKLVVPLAVALVALLGVLLSILFRG